MKYEELIMKWDWEKLDSNNLTDSEKELLIRREYIKQSINWVKSDSNIILIWKTGIISKDRIEQTRKIAEAFKQHADRDNYFPKNIEKAKEIIIESIYIEILDKISINISSLINALSTEWIPNNINKLYINISKNTEELQNILKKEKTKITNENNREKLSELKKITNIYGYIDAFLKWIQEILSREIILYHKKDALVKELTIIEKKIENYLNL